MVLAGAPEQKAPTKTEWLRWPPRRARVAIGIALAVNLVLLLAYLWSRGGQTTHLRIEARGDEITVLVDGRVQARERLDVPARGGLFLALEDTHNIPSLPSPRGIDRVRVTDLKTGEMLFDEGFDDGIGPGWQEQTGAFTSDDGALGARGRATLATGARDWGDYAVDVRMRNAPSVEIVTRVGEGRAGAVTTLERPWGESDDSGTLSLVAGGPGVATIGDIVELKKSESARMALAMALRPYPWMVILVVGGLLTVAALTFVSVRVPEQVRRWIAPLSPGWAAAGLAYASLAVTLYLAFSVLDGIPHVPDEVAFVFQSKVLASGQLAADPPPVEAAFEFFPTPFVQTFDGRYAAVYPFGHPMLLAIGEVFGAPWLIPPVVGALTIGLLYLLGRRWFGAWTGLTAAGLLATSPFFLMQSSSMMSHSTAALYFVASLLAVANIAGPAPRASWLARMGMDRDPRWAALMGVLAGLAFGLFFNTRPLTALAAAPAVGALVLGLVWRMPRRDGVAAVAGVLAGGLAMVGAYLLYNYGTTGDAFLSGYQSSGDPSQQVGFGGRHSVAAGIQNEQTQLAFLLLVLPGWPTWVGLGFVLLPFVLGTRDGRDWFLLACALLMMSAWAWFEGAGVMYGPRYWYETAPLLMLLAARGAGRAVEAMAGAVSAFSAQRQSGVAEDAGHRGQANALAAVLVYGFVAALVAGSLYGWLLGQRTTWRADLVPERATAMRGFLGMDDRIYRMVQDRDLHNALVLVEDCTQFQCYGSVFWRNAPGLDGDIVYAKDVAALREDIIAAYPGREVWLAKYTVPSLEPYRPRD